MGYALDGTCRNSWKVWATQGSALRSARPVRLLAAPLLEGGTCNAENTNCGPQAPKYHGHAHTLWSDKVTPATGSGWMPVRPALLPRYDPGVCKLHSGVFCAPEPDGAS